MPSNETTGRFTTDDAIRVRNARRLAFFLSKQRVSLLPGELEEADRLAIEGRLARWQSVCGCSVATMGLVLAGLLAFVQHRGAIGIILSGVLCAMAAKCVAIAVAYLAYRHELTRTVARLQLTTPRSAER
jgi:hypothetical protein